MKVYKVLTLILGYVAPLSGFATEECATDSVEVLAFAAHDGTGGLKLAVKDAATDEWRQLGDSFSLVSSDFGPWGSYKKMFSPNLVRNPDGTWTAIWTADREGVIAYAVSQDLIHWQPQIYRLQETANRESDVYTVNGASVHGNVVVMPCSQIRELEAYLTMKKDKETLYVESVADDSTRFVSLGTVHYNLVADPVGSKQISDKLIGIFFEDINYAADGGLYAELLQNRDFEYTPSEHRNDPTWNALMAWCFPAPEKGGNQILSESPVHPNNPHYLRLSATEAGYGIANGGFEGIALKACEPYTFSMKARTSETVTISVKLVDDSGKTLHSAIVDVDGSDWTTYQRSLVPDADTGAAKLVLEMQTPGSVDIDMVSLFPQNTFKGRKNGLRKDLAQCLADLKPKFMRFPGGCVAHGDGVDNIYDWKGSIGPLEARKPLPNIWRYHQSRGLGYHEYFLFCEDIGAEPLPVLAAGVPCQNSGTPAHHSHDPITSRGQQGGIPMEEMDAYVQDILDLIEYANGPVDSVWGAKRAEAGHPEPFNLKYIGIGNEDMITEVFVPRFTMIFEAVKAAYPEIEVVGTVGPFYEGSDYDAGWELARSLDVPLVDEHYYVQPGWMIYNQDFYDEYPRGGTRVYLGEYAAHVPGRKSNMESALAEALYLTSVERNADVVTMTSYAPLLAKEGHTQWRPDLIYFTNTDIRPTTDYHVQKLYGNNSGNVYIPCIYTIDTDNEKAAVRVGHSLVRDEETGDYILKLVNLLPVEVETTIDVSAIDLESMGPVSCTILAGEPRDSRAVPVSSVLHPADVNDLSYTMQPYSFTVLRFSK